jgi:uncharacterized protein (TIGR03435 family)
MSNSANGRCKRLLLGGVWTLGCWVNAPSAAAQPTPTPGAKFEVATIRPARSASMPQGGGDQGKRGIAQSAGGAGANVNAPPPPPPRLLPGGGGCIPRTTLDAGYIDRRCVSLRELLLNVFAVAPARLLAPDWTETQVFDISAKLPEGATQEQLPEMFQSLLEERFGLTFHRESKEGPINALVVAKGGVKVKAAAPQSAQPPWVAAAAAVSGPYGDGFIGGIRFRSITVPNSDGPPMFVLQTPSMGFVRRSNTGGPDGIIHYEAPSITLEGLADLAVIAGDGLDPAVVDMTGLKGRYQVNLDISMNLGIGADLFAAISRGERELATATSHRAELKVVQDGLKKLGLQLEPRKGPVSTVIIDHLEKTPTAN